MFASKGQNLPARAAAVGLRVALALGVASCARSIPGDVPVRPPEGPAPRQASAPRLPHSSDTARIVFVGDTGTGYPRAHEVAARMERVAEQVPVSHAFLLGDNIYPHGEIHFIGRKFLDVYRGVLSRGVSIRAALGNHDVDHCKASGRRPLPRDGEAYRVSSRCRVDAHLSTPEFGYRDGLRYYSIQVPERASEDAPENPIVEVFVLDTNTLGSDRTKIDDGNDQAQLLWIEEALQRSTAHWKVVAMHGTMYAPARCHWLGMICRDDDAVLRSQLEAIFVEHGVDAVFQGHQHLYARFRPQRGIQYFVSGAGGKLPDPAREDERIVQREDRGAFNHFVLVQATEDRFGYCAIDTEGTIRDRGVLTHGDPGPAEPVDCPLPDRE